MKRFSIDQITQLLEAQNTLNIKYTGEDWRDVVPMSSFSAANIAELGELLESSPRTGDNDAGWKWWKPYLENDVNNIKVEGIDIIHFSLSMVLKAYSVADAVTLYDKYTDELETPNVPLPMNNLLIAVSTFTVMSNMTEDPVFIQSFAALMESVSEYTGMSMNAMFMLYAKKNALNHARVEGGYQEGTYQKIDENGEEDNVRMFDNESDNEPDTDNGKS